MRSSLRRGRLGFGLRMAFGEGVLMIEIVREFVGEWLLMQAMRILPTLKAGELAEAVYPLFQKWIERDFKRLSPKAQRKLADQCGDKWSNAK